MSHHDPDLKQSSGRGRHFTLSAGFFFTMFLLLSLPGPTTVGSSGANTLIDSATALQSCVIICPGNVTQNNDPGQCGAVVNYPWPTVYGPCVWSCQPPPGAFFQVGTTGVGCTAFDSAGQPVAQCTFTVTVEDREPPRMVCGGVSGPGDVTVSNDPGQCGAMVEIEGEVPDNCGLGDAHCSHEGRLFFPVGTTTVTCTATDASGNTSTCSFTVTVNDTEAPTMTAPQDIVTTNDPRRADASVNYPMPTASDNCAGVQVSCSPPPHTPFPIGTTQVTCTGTDAANNSASCSFAVKVMPVWPVLVSSAFQIRTGGASESPDSAEQAPAEPGLLVADCLTDEVKAFVSNRDGTFRLSQRLRVGDMPSAVAYGDFNKDGNTDVATANMLSDDVSILLGNGDGSFRDLGSVRVGNHPRALVAGEFTSDGRLDLAVVNLSDNDIMVLRGHGDGSFEPGLDSAVEIEPTAMAAGDFNRDNRLDLAISNFGSDTITVLMGQGDGRFTPSGRFPVGAGPMALAAGDFDTDSRLDLATANFTSGTISILKNMDGQRFSEARRLPTGNGPVALVAGRLLNQYWGLAVVNLLAGEIVIRLGDATGTLSTSQRYAVTPTPSSLTVGDFNTDGRLDLAVMDYSSDGSEAGEFAAKQIIDLKQSPGGDKIVLAYMSIGEAEDYRFYWQKNWRPGNPPWLDRQNPNWPGNYKVHYWDPAWQAIIFEYIDRLLNAGFDGAYLDIIDAYEYYAERGRTTAAQEMVDFVAAIAAHARARDPDFYIFPQNAPELATVIPAYLKTVNGIGQEDVYYGYEEDDQPTPPEVTAQLEDYLEVFKNAGKLLLTIDYATTPAHVNDAYAKSRAKDYVPFCTVRELDQLTINPGHEPD